MPLFDFAWSFIAAMRASAAAGRAFRFRDRGDMTSALQEARVGLDLLRMPYVRRSSPHEASVLASLTIVMEQDATETGASGASIEDLADSIAILKALKGEREPDLCFFIPFLESRLGSSSPVA